MQKNNFSYISFALIIATIFTSITASIAATAETPIITNPNPKKLDIVYHPDYNISFYGIEKFLHSFDGQKYGKIIKNLNTWTYHSEEPLKYPKTINGLGMYIKMAPIHRRQILSQFVRIHTPTAVSEQDLLLCHTDQYLQSLTQSAKIARIAEIPPLRYVPNYFLQKKLLKPMLLATGGTILGAELALKNGCAINLSGGYHHAKSNNGEGFCFYADIPIAIKKLWQKNPNLRVMIIDLDAHQGNGIEAILKDDPRIHMLDMYNSDIYPQDQYAAQYIKTNIPVHSGIKDDEYLAKLNNALTKAVASMAQKPDLIIYNAGTDIFEKDPLGHMKVSEAGIIKRDSLIFDAAQQHKIPILMVLSGGYSQESAHIISKSIKTLINSVRLNNATGASAGAHFDQTNKNIVNTINVARDSQTKNNCSINDVSKAVISSAVGDALGRVTEFKKSMQTIFDVYPDGVSTFDDFNESDWENIPRTFKNTSTAPYTDDTAMAKIVLQELIKARRENYTLDQTMSTIAHAFINDMHDTHLGWAAPFRAPGISTMKAIRILEHKMQNKQMNKKNWWAVGLPDSGGCGSVMRAYPFGIIFCDNPEKAGEWAAQHSLLTHGHPWAQAACAAMAVGMALVLNPKNSPEYVTDQMVLAARKYDASTSDKIADAIALAHTSKKSLTQFKSIKQALKNNKYRKFHEEVFSKYEGWKADDAIAATVYVFMLFPQDIESALYTGVNTPGDSDSIAAMAGALVGARDTRMPPFFAHVEGYEELQALAAQINLSPA